MKKPPPIVLLAPLVLALLLVSMYQFIDTDEIVIRRRVVGDSNPANVEGTSTAAEQAQKIIVEVNPEQGYSIKVSYGDLGPQVLASGAIDLEKFRPLNDEYRRILTAGSEEKIVIKKDNAYFLLNFFWALGLANRNPLLDDGPITRYGRGQIGSFASTGGWTLGEKPTMEFYSSAGIIKLTPKQQARVEEVAGNVYRPCCGNPTSFPDCNHGMALLAVLELLAANGASVDEMYEAAKYFNAFWFPQQYLDLATYFKANEGKDFRDVDAEVIVGRDFSSAQGWSKTKQWLAANNLVEKVPSGGGGCGV